METEGVIDRGVLDSLLDSVGGDGEFLSELLATYFEDSPQLFSTMHDSLSRGDAEEFRMAAHSLKSNSANFGAMSLSRKAKALEDMGKSNDLQGAGDSLKDAEEEYAKVKSALEAIQENG
jgi:HPt (histidine-containing phosphotransfer) domain-containing protein